MSERREESSFFTSFILGLLAGATITFLFGSEEGKKIKKRLIKKSQELFDDLPELIEEAKEKKEALTKDIKKITKNVEKKSQKVEQQLQKTSKTVAPHLKNLQKRGRQAAKKVNRFFRRSGHPLSS
jgi:gas vesicle protein